MTTVPKLDDNDGLGHLNAFVTELTEQVTAGNVDADTLERIDTASRLAEAFEKVGTCYRIALIGLKAAAVDVLTEE